MTKDKKESESLEKVQRDLISIRPSSLVKRALDDLERLKAHPPSGPEQSQSKSILIVEDEETLREALKRIFVKEGFAVDGAESAEKGLALLESNDYDVIISDIVLPDMDGIEMLTKVRERISDQIVIVITDYASLDTSVKALRAGAYDYIMKPIIHEEIKKNVKNALRQKDLQRENALLRREIEAQSFVQKLSIEEYAKAFIRKYQSQYDEQQLADMLGITKKSLRENRKKWGIPKEQ